MEGDCEQSKISTLPGSTSQLYEMLGIKAAMDRADNTEPLTIRTESKYAAQILDGKWQKVEDQGCIGVKNGEMIRTTVVKIRQRQAETYLLQVDNKTVTENDRTAKKKANEALESGTADEANTEIPAQYCEVKLKTITQRTATKAIRIQKMRQAVAITNGKTPTDSQIWKSCKCSDISMKIRHFMWKLIHECTNGRRILDRKDKCRRQRNGPNSTASRKTLELVSALIIRPLTTKLEVSPNGTTSRFVPFILVVTVEGTTKGEQRSRNQRCLGA
ncbi:hypothetical protein VNI00_014527 [Paramarasmius palmivorus]|uniref:Reverse transcriptase n=1 Tax=Paramarasmius palmivorus TaxID=297713 RepID=A0AAW0BT77_9AGAR